MKLKHRRQKNGRVRGEAGNGFGHVLGWSQKATVSDSKAGRRRKADRKAKSKGWEES